MATRINIVHPFLRHCEKVTTTPVKGTVIHGNLPTWLEGELTRNGPGIQEVGETKYNHVFDGLAVLHKFTIRNGVATYQNRAVESEAYRKNMAANRIVVSEFGTVAFPDPCQSLLGRWQSKFLQMRGKPDVTDNCSVNLEYYGDQLYAMTETNFVRQIDPETLKTVGGPTNISDYCVVNTASAHPHVLEDGSILNVGNNFRHKKGGPHYCFIKVPPAHNSEETAFKNAKIVAEIPARWKWNPSYFHSFGMTTDKIIFVEYPLCMNIPSLILTPLTGTTFEGCLKWYGNEKARFHVVSMVNGEPHPVIYESDPFFVFHHINAYEEDGHIVVDVAGHEGDNIVRSLKHNHKNEGVQGAKGSTARRFVLPLNVDSNADPSENLVRLKGTTATAKIRKGTNDTGVVDLTPQHITDDWVELTRINYAYNGKKYRFAYGLRSTDPEGGAFPLTDKLTKIDFTTNQTLDYVTDQPGFSEPVFVSDPTKSNPAEDDGVLLTTLFHKDPTVVSLVVLDAKNMTEICKVQFQTEGAVTGTFHGIWHNA